MKLKEVEALCQAAWMRALQENQKMQQNIKPISFQTWFDREKKRILEQSKDRQLKRRENLGHY